MPSKSATRHVVTGDPRREKIIRWSIGGAVAMVCIAVIAVAVVARNITEPEMTAAAPGGAIVADAALPQGVRPAGDAYAFAVPYGANEQAPVLELWEDFQCPGCGQLESLRGDALKDAAEAGDVRLMLRPTAFLDPRLGNTASAQAIAAWGCAIDQGKTREFHGAVFAAQPTTEGTGWTQADLLEFGRQAGVNDPAAFTSCVKDARYADWATNATQTFYDAEISGTPSGILSGTPIETSTLIDPDAFSAALAAAREAGPATP